MSTRYAPVLRTVAFLLLVHAPPSVGQQVADSAFRPPIEKPAYSFGRGPVVLFDEAHENFHTADGRYLPTADLIRRDGYVVLPSGERFTPDLLQEARVLLIANARKPIDADETSAVRKWVSNGGALLLIVDHPPNVAAAELLASEFGVRLRNGGAVDPNISDNRLVFRPRDGTLIEHSVTSGIDSVVTFTGSSFELVGPGQPLLVFGAGVQSFLPQDDPEKDDPDPLPLKGHLQGAALTIGSGRIAVFAEAAMFSAQLAGPERRPMGMNATIARQNVQLLLNVLHWLTRVTQ